MKGIIFNLLEDVVSNHLDPDVWDDVVESADVTGVYSAIGSYEDAEFVSLLSKLPPAAGTTTSRRLRWFGRHAMPVLAERYSVFFEPHTTMTTFLPMLNDVIHPEVRKLYPGADVPVFELDHLAPDVVALTYRSHRGLCALAEGFVIGAAGVFGEVATVSQDRCSLDGAESCLIVCELSRVPSRVGG